MRVALYARYSSENQKESSIDDQFRNCEQRAVREGWTITARYEHRAISGSTVDRTGYQQLLKDAKTRQFDVLLVDSFSRLSRDSMEAEHTRRRFVHWGVRLIGCSDGVDTAVEGHELQSGVQGLMNQRFLKDLAKNIKRGMVGKAEKHYWLGGRIYGYKLVPELHPTKTDPYGQPERIGTRLAINDEQANVVREIFRLYADGLSPLKIADELNRRKVPAPRPTGWRGSTIHGNLVRGIGIINNPLYVGLYRWNRSRREKDPDTAYTTHIMRDKSEWVETAVPHLRIIDDRLWEEVRARRKAVSFGVVALQAIHSRARSTGARPKYLFSGLLTCGVCGGNFVIATHTHYGCLANRTLGPTTCANGLKVDRQLVESRLLRALKDDLYTAEGLAVFSEEVRRLLARSRRTRTPDVAQAKARLAAVELEITHIVNAIKQGIITTSTKDALQFAAQGQHGVAHAARAETTEVRQVFADLKGADLRLFSQVIR